MVSSRQKDDLCETVLEIVANFSPEDVFGEDILKEWALDNGFVEDTGDTPKT